MASVGEMVDVFDAKLRAFEAEQEGIHCRIDVGTTLVTVWMHARAGGDVPQVADCFDVIRPVKGETREHLEAMADQLIPALHVQLTRKVARKAAS